MAEVSGSATTSNTTAQGTSLSVSLPSHADGDLLVICINIGAGPAATLSGWTKVEAGSAQCGAAIFYKFATGTDSEGSSVSVTWSGSRQAVASVYKVINADAVEDSSTVVVGSPSTTFTIPSIDAVGADSLVIATVGLQNTALTATFPAGFENQVTPDSSGSQAISGSAATDPVGDGATGSMAVTISSGARGAGAAIVISHAAGGTTIDASVSETTGASDSQAPEAEYNASTSESVVAGDSQAPQAQYYASATEGAGVSESQAAGAEYSADTTESAGLTDTGAASAEMEAAVSEAAGLTDAPTSTVEGIDLADWEPVAGHVGYIWQEGAAWTEVSAASLGITESTADIAVPIESHIDANREQRSSYTLPAGVFNLTTELRVNRSQKRIVGAGSDLTTILVSGTGKIVFAGGDGSTSNIVGSPARGDTTVEVVDASIASVGDIIAVKQTADDTVTCTDDNTSPYSVGTITSESFAEDPWAQCVRVTAVDEIADEITFEPALALDYDSGKSPYVKVFNTDEDVGIEGVTIKYTTDNGAKAVEFDRIQKGYAKDVRLIDYPKYGITCRECYEIEIHECRVIGAQDTGTGGNGYSIHAELASTFVHVHDNALKGPHRHPLIIQSGASHCVFAHNYIADASIENLTTLSVHGHDVHHNLFEGNVIQGTIEVNDFYTATRKNLLYRNKVIYDANFWDSTSRDYAIWMRRNSVAAFIANRLSGFTSVSRVFDCSESSLIQENGSSDSAPSYGGNSRYLSAKPSTSIWSAYTWPVFAGDTDGTIPAQAFDLTGGITYSAAASEDIGLTDAQTRTIDIAAAVSESVAQSDSQGPDMELVRALVETLGLTTQAQAVADLIASVQEAYAAGDTWAVNMVHNVTAATESLSIGDLVTAAVSGPDTVLGAILETLGISSESAALLDASAQLGEEAGLTDNQSATMEAAVAASENAAFTAQAAALLSAISTLTEGYALSDSVQAQVIGLLSGAMVETAGMQDALAPALVLVSVLSESTGVQDSQIASMQMSEAIMEATTFSDTWSASAILNAAAVEPMGLQDATLGLSGAGFPLGVILIASRAAGEVSLQTRAEGSMSASSRAGGAVTLNT